MKAECCRLRKSGASPREVYDEYYKTQITDACGYASFERSLRYWMKIDFPDSTTLECGTYEGFTAHGATVQVSKTGEIVQAWIKQKADDVDPKEFLNALHEVVEPYKYKPENLSQTSDMLEIPLFDMHWGIAFMDYYKPVLDEVLRLINSQNWARIVIPFGQDFFHNDSIVNGITTKGTVIEKIDMIRAVKEGRQFMYSIIETAISCADEVKVIYSAGNHDTSISWMFMQVLLERYSPEIVDDTMQYRKVITYGKTAVMVTHGDSKKATPKNLAHIFPVSFAEEFANANVREVHAGHLHHETDTDVYGVMVRRLSSGNKIDDWTDKEDHVGSHRRFMLFHWGLDKLKSIYYI